MIIFGSMFGGKVQQADNQWIETKYFLLMVPLFPVTTMFVTGSEFRSRSGFEISMYGKSVGHGYLRFFSFILALVCFGVSLFGDSYMLRDLPVSPALAGTAFALLYAWSVLNHRHATGAHLLERRRLGAIVGLNALPEWMPDNVRRELEEKIRQEVIAAFGSDNMRDNVQRRDVGMKETALLYAYLRYKKISDPSGAYNADYELVLNRYNQAMMTKGSNAFSDLQKQMPDDLTDDASHKMAQ